MENKLNKAMQGRNVASNIHNFLTDGQQNGEQKSNEIRFCNLDRIFPSICVQVTNADILF